MKALALAVTKYQMDGNNGGYVYLLPNKVPVNDPDQSGYKPMKMAINHADYEKISKMNLPSFVSIEAEYIGAGGDKAKPIVEDIEPLKEGNQKIGLIEIKQVNIPATPNK